MTATPERRSELQEQDHKDYHGGFDLIREAKHQAERQWLEALARVTRRWVPNARYLRGSGWIDGDGGNFLLEDILDADGQLVDEGWIEPELESDISMYLDALAGLWPGEEDYLGETKIDLGEVGA